MSMGGTPSRSSTMRPGFATQRQRARSVLTWDYLKKPRRLRPAIVECQAKVFRIGREAEDAATQITWLSTNMNRIVQRSRKAGGWIWVVRESRIEPYWPKS